MYKIFRNLENIREKKINSELRPTTETWKTENRTPQPLSSPSKTPAGPDPSTTTVCLHTKRLLNDTPGNTR